MEKNKAGDLTAYPILATLGDEVKEVSPRKVSKSGKVYYEQSSPTKRGFPQRGIRLSQDEAKAFDEDAATSDAGTVAGYIRSLWLADRKARNRPPLESYKSHD